MKRITVPPTWEGFRHAAREALDSNTAPEDVVFVPEGSDQDSLFGQMPAPRTPSLPTTPPPAWRLPKAFVALAQSVVVHRDPKRYDLLYRLMWRIVHGEPDVLAHSAEADVVAVHRLDKAVHRDVHKCHAFVRFRAIHDAAAPGGQHFIAWYEPDHLVIPLAVPHFVERFAAMRWTLLTPDASATCADGVLTLGPGAKREDAPKEDAMEAMWSTYYASIFNPARLNMRATRQEMPKRFWRNMPETEQIAALTRAAPAQTEAFMRAQPPRAIAKPSYADLGELGTEISACTVCPWAAHATASVRGEGTTHAPLMIVGEQPGDQEDVQGRPFVGPAGILLAQAMAEAGLDRQNAYVTNAVKHFKFTLRGKRRIHQKPSATDVAACRSWLLAELGLVKPDILLCLGTTAALSVFGKATLLKDVRGTFHTTAACAKTFVTTHPSAILRTPEPQRDAAYAALVADLRQVRVALDQG